jgi:hypothetical protein
MVGQLPLLEESLHCLLFHPTKSTKILSGSSWRSTLSSEAFALELLLFLLVSKENSSRNVILLSLLAHLL